MEEDRLALKEAASEAQDVLDFRAERLNKKEEGFLRDIIINNEDPTFPYEFLTEKQTSWLHAIFDRTMK